MTLTKEEEEIASEFRKMLKFAIAPDAVRHKMRKEDISSKIVFAVLGPDPNQQPPPSSTAAPSPSALTNKEEEIALTYRKMLKVSIQPNAVRHKMIKEQISDKIITAVLGPSEEIQPLTTPKNRTNKIRNSAPTHALHADTKQRGNNARGKLLVSLHWTLLSGQELEHSVWSKTAKKKHKRNILEPSVDTTDVAKLEELFQKKNNVGSEYDQKIWRWRWYGG